ncbi:unnamed protein product [Meloidogyne enterolobii]|uniref:Uncharacterized protein n=1 Tax=Meloidogyne enterolobii TaxID=390850 RepID=A0ACB1B0G1_MELEN
MPKEVKDKQYAVCDKSLCNTKKFFDQTFSCLNKGKEEGNHKKGLKRCNGECFVYRHSDGKVEKGCGTCKGKDSKDCYACKKDYCNEEKNVYKHCWENNGKICKNKYNEECFTERTKTNGVNKGCGICPSKACETCNKNRCNDGLGLKYYCRSKEVLKNKNGVKECDKPECYIKALNESRNEFDFGCGNCEISDLNCAQCNHGALCNNELFFKSVIYCWEKDLNNPKPLSVKTECKSECFVLRDLNGKVKQGCGKCPDNDPKSDCKNCKKRYCNVESLVPKQCWTNNGNICKTSFETPCFVEKMSNNTGINY